MGPKKKGKSGRNAKGSSGIVDGISISEMSREQLEPFVLRIQRELEREREERNFFQIERDKVKTFWEITRQQLEEYRSSLRNKDKEFERTDATHQKELKIYQQKIKHLVYGQHTEISELKIENMLVLRNVEQDLSQQELQLLDENRALRGKNIKENETHANELRTLFLENKKKCSKMRFENESGYRALECKYQNHLQKTRAELQLHNEIKLANLEEQKNMLVKRSNENHRNVCDEFTNFYCNIIVNNLALISVLKDKLQVTQNEVDQLRNEIREIKKRNRELTFPLKTAYDKIMNLENELNKCGRKFSCDRISQKCINSFKEKIENMRVKHQSIVENQNKVVNEKQTANDKFVDELINLQKKIARRWLMVEGMISKLKTTAEREETYCLESYPLDKSKSEKIAREKNNYVNLLMDELQGFDALSNAIQATMMEFKSSNL